MSAMPDHGDVVPARCHRTRSPKLDLRQLHAFVAVAEERHFGRAAMRIHIARSPLSRIIRKVEADVGVALFVRDNRNVVLTQAGEALLEGAHELLLLADAVVNRVAAMRHLQ